jgi:hypothetical protein
LITLSAIIISGLHCIFRIALAKAAIRKNSTLCTSKLDFNFRKKPVKCYIWSIVFYGFETWTLRKVDYTYLESFEMWRWRIMEKISWTDRVTNDKVLFRSKVEEDYPKYNTNRERKATWIGHIQRRNCLLKRFAEG